MGNEITANQIFGNDNVSALQFDGSTYVTMPNGLIDPEYGSETLEASFETTTGGVIFGVQAGDAGISPGNGWLPLLYVGTNGLLYGGSSDSYGGQVVQITSTEPVDDGNWHNVALVFDASAGTINLYLDGQLEGSLPGTSTYLYDAYNQIGTGYTDYWSATPGGWYGFQGEITKVQIWDVARSAAEVAQDASAPVSAMAPGLLADYLFDEGQGPTAYDQTANHNDGTLAGVDGDLPTWLLGTGEAIDLGNDGITYNAVSPRQARTTCRISRSS